MTPRFVDGAPTGLEPVTSLPLQSQLGYRNFVSRTRPTNRALYPLELGRGAWNSPPHTPRLPAERFGKSLAPIHDNPKPNQ